ncbi:hypothetical protein ACFV2N_48615 [Streptomyces sp. NPDC059680]|uniref:hypothetical protein n=1 Tax=Streptomyces sp. NPDC059680 TaxID=3346904 RepID=UPI003684AADD
MANLQSGADIMEMRVYRDDGETQGEIVSDLTNDSSAARWILEALIGKNAYFVQPESSPMILLAGCEEDPLESHIIRGID